jgi:hypothetical protein
MWVYYDHACTGQLLYYNVFLSLELFCCQLEYIQCSQGIELTEVIKRVEIGINMFVDFCTCMQTRLGTRKINAMCLLLYLGLATGHRPAGHNGLIEIGRTRKAIKRS